MGSLLQCQVQVDVAASSKKEKQIFNDSSTSEMIFERTKKGQKIHEKDVPVAVEQVAYAFFYTFYQNLVHIKSKGGDWDNPTKTFLLSFFSFLSLAIH